MNYEQSVSYILCRRFGIECEKPEISRLSELYEGGETQERKLVLDSTQDISGQIVGAIEMAIPL